MNIRAKSGAVHAAWGVSELTVCTHRPVPSGERTDDAVTCKNCLKETNR